nr:carboxymuconolactone decarboxylase family protein [uncultured Halomonas sp.]
MNELDGKLDPKGIATRREVLGDTYVDNSLNGSDEFSWPLQELVTSHCWSDLWARPGLPIATRSLVVVAMLTALNRPHELKTHLRGALNNGCTPEEIREVLLQSAGYCGFPAALDGFRVARELFAEEGIEFTKV